MKGCQRRLVDCMEVQMQSVLHPNLQRIVMTNEEAFVYFSKSHMCIRLSSEYLGITGIDVSCCLANLEE